MLTLLAFAMSVVQSAPEPADRLAALETGLGFALPDLAVAACSASTRDAIGLAEATGDVICLESAQADADALAGGLKRGFDANGYAPAFAEGPAATYENDAQSVTVTAFPLGRDGRIWVTLAAFQAL